MNGTRKLTPLLIASVCIMFTCTMQAQTYQDDINGWYQDRVQNLRADNGWLNLVGLYWLKEGKNSFGSGEKVSVRLPDAAMPAAAGYFELKNGIVTQYTNDGTVVLVNGQGNSKAIIFDSSTLKTAPVSAYHDLRWTVIKRSSSIGIRLRNLKSEAVTNFKGIEHFPADSTWRVTATLHAPTIPGSVSNTNILGQTHAEKTPGKLYFTLSGHEYTLDALEENNKLFIIFADNTNGESTYPTGRFLVAEKTTDGGSTVLDFNKAYNPPCAFSDYATCPIPPKQNVLPVAITAGEKTYGHHKVGDKAPM